MTTIEKEISAPDRPQDDFSSRRFTDFEVYYGFFLLLLVLMVLTNAGLFVVHGVRVKGNHSVTQPEIITASQINADQTLLQIAINQQRIRHNLLQDVRIASAVINLRFPNRVVITVKERKPLCLLKNEDNLLVVSYDAVVLGKATGDEDNLPLVRGISIRDAAIGAKIRDAKMQTVLAIFHEADPKIQRTIRGIDLRNLQLFLNSQGSNHTIPVDLGSSENIVAKMANLRAILTNTDINRIAKIDLRVAELPSIIKTSGSEAAPTPSPDPN